MVNNAATQTGTAVEWFTLDRTTFFTLGRRRSVGTGTWFQKELGCLSLSLVVLLLRSSLCDEAPWAALVTSDQASLLVLGLLRQTTRCIIHSWHKEVQQDVLDISYPCNSFFLDVFDNFSMLVNIFIFSLSGTTAKLLVCSIMGVTTNSIRQHVKGAPKEGFERAHQ